MPQRLDHIDLRVRNLVEAQPFYARLLPALGFVRPMPIPGWFQLESEDGSEFFGIQEDPDYRANTTRIAFRAGSAEEVDEFARLLTEIGAIHLEGPAEEAPGYYAVFFEDPSGNRLEIVHRSVD